MTERRTHYRTCNLCEAMCGVAVELHGSEVASIRGDDRDVFSRGHICPKATALADLHADPDRLRRPVRRVGNDWEEVSWEWALAEVVERLHSIQSEHGRDAVGVYLGNPNVHNFGTMVFGPPLLRALRTKHRFSASSADQLPAMMASYFMYKHQLLFPIPDVDRTELMVIIGANPLASNGSIMAAPGIKKRLRAVQDRGGKVVVIDPRRTETAELANRHHFIRPGTDALLLLSVVHELFFRGVDPGRLRSVVDRIEVLEATAREFPPEVTAAATGVSPAAVRQLVDELRAAGSAVVYGRVGACTQEFGTLVMWLINAVNVLTGNLDRPGGSMFATPAVDVLGKLAGRFGVGRGTFDRWRSRVRGLPEFGGELPVAVLAEEILTPGTGQIRAMVTVAGNPVLSVPNGSRIDEAYAALDFAVSIDFYVNETSRHADIILPPVSPIQRAHYDLALYLTSVRNVAKYSQPAFELGDDERDDWEILADITCGLLERRDGRFAKHTIVAKLARALGPERILDLALRLGPYGRRLRGGLSLASLRRTPHGRDLGPLVPQLPAKLPDGRIDLAPEQFVADVARLRAHLDESAEPGAMVLIGRRHLRSNNSWMHNSARLLKGKDRCTAMVHPDDADRLGLEAGTEVRLRSRVGEIVVPVEVTDQVMPGVVSLPHGFGHGRDGVRLRIARERPGASINDLTDDHLIDALSGNAAFNGLPVTITPMPL